MARRRTGSKAAPVVARHYVLRGETGHINVSGGEATLDVRLVAERLCELTGEAIERRRGIKPSEREAIDRRKRELKAAMTELRDIGERLSEPGAADLAARLDLAVNLSRVADAMLAAALALGFHHRGGSEAVEEALRESK